LALLLGLADLLAVPKPLLIKGALKSCRLIG
jgi:hypothetical protein